MKRIVSLGGWGLAATGLCAVVVACSASHRSTFSEGDGGGNTNPTGTGGAPPITTGNGNSGGFDPGSTNSGSNGNT